MMDEAISYGTGCFGETAPGFDAACHRRNLDAMQKLVPADRLAASVGAVETPAHINATCNWDGKQLSQCYDYGWNQTTLRAFLSMLSTGGVRELNVWRQDLAPPPGQTSDIPQWFREEVARWRNPGYGGRASVSL
jgi:hypothetical protein